MLGSTAFGLIGFATGILLYLKRLADGGLELGLGIQLIAHDRSRIQTVAPALLTARLIVSASLAAVLAAIGFLFLPTPEGAVFATYGLGLLAVGASTRWIHLGLEKARAVAFARAAGELTMVALVLVWVHSPKEIVLVPASQVLGDSLAAVLLLLWLRRWSHRLSFRFEWATVRSVMPRAWPLVAGSILSLLVYNSDLIFLRIFRDLSAIGVYVAAYQLISFLGNLSAAYSSSLLPTLTRLGRTPLRQQELYHTAMAHTFAVAFPITVGGLVLAPQIIRFVFGEAYALSALPLQILIGTVTVGVLRDTGLAALLAAGEEHRILRMNAVATAVSLLANLLLIPSLGIAGAAAATLATECVRLLLATRYARDADFSPPPLSRLWKPVPAALAMGAVLALWRTRPLWAAIPIGAAVYFTALFALGGVRLRRGTLPSLGV